MFKSEFQYSCFAGSISAKSATEEEKNNRTTQHLFLSSLFQRHAVISANTQSFMGPTGLPSWTNTEEIQSTISGKQCDSVVLFSKRNDPNSLSLVMNGKKTYLLAFMCGLLTQSDHWSANYVDQGEWLCQAEYMVWLLTFKTTHPHTHSNFACCHVLWVSKPVQCTVNNSNL